MKRHLSMIYAGAMMACQLAQADSPAEPFYTLVDLTDDFVAFYEQSHTLSVADRMPAMQKYFAPLLPGFYDYMRLSSYVSPEQYQQMYGKAFDEFPQKREAILKTTAHFNAMMQPAQTAFKKEFPDIAPLGDIYLVHSLGEMDGGTRTINDKTVFVFGADVMARIYPIGQEQAFFHHEIFHMYHSQFFSSCDQVWCFLWREGLAVYVSHALNPDADDLQLGLTMPRPIRAEVNKQLNKAVCTVQARFNSEDTQHYSELFRGNNSVADLPPRFGYYVGYLAAREAAKTYSLNELAHLTVESTKPILEKALSAVAPCP